MDLPKTAFAEIQPFAGAGHDHEIGATLALHECGLPLRCLRGEDGQYRRGQSSLRLRQRDEKELHRSSLWLSRLSPIAGAFTESQKLGEGMSYGQHTFPPRLPPSHCEAPGCSRRAWPHLWQPGQFPRAHAPGLRRLHSGRRIRTPCRRAGRRFDHCSVHNCAGTAAALLSAETAEIHRIRQTKNAQAPLSQGDEDGFTDPIKDQWKRRIASGSSLPAYLRGPFPNTWLKVSVRLCARNGREIALLENQAMVDLVAGDHKSNRARRDFLLAGDTALRPGVLIEGPKKRDAGGADGGKFVGQV